MTLPNRTPGRVPVTEKRFSVGEKISFISSNPFHCFRRKHIKRNTSTFIDHLTRSPSLFMCNEIEQEVQDMGTRNYLVVVNYLNFFSLM